MTPDPTDPTDLEAAIVAVYRGPLEEFISRRDALAKQLRASKRREDADRVKALRKPSRVAWTLDQVALGDPAPVGQLARVILAAQEGHSVQDDVRQAVRAVAEAGAREAIRGGHPIESTALVAALRAVMGDANAFADLRAGRLVDIPEGGGLDLLGVAGATSPPPAKPAAKSARGEGDTAAAPAELQRAETLLTKARERAQTADRAVTAAQDRLDTAEEQLRLAQEKADERRAELERARQGATAAATELGDAEKRTSELRERLKRP
jgi:hypothetical protein